MDRLWLISAHGLARDRYAKVPAGVFLHFVASGNEGASDVGSDSFLTREGFNDQLRLGRFQTYRPGDAYPDLDLSFIDNDGLITGLFDVDALRLRERVMTRGRNVFTFPRFTATSQAAALQFTQAHAFKTAGRCDSWQWIMRHTSCHLSDAIKPLWRGHIIVSACRGHPATTNRVTVRDTFPYALNASPHRRMFPGKRKYVTHEEIIAANPTLVRDAKAMATLQNMQKAHDRQEHEDITRLMRMLPK